MSQFPGNYSEEQQKKHSEEQQKKHEDFLRIIKQKEKDYRRGFTHGVFAAMNGLTLKEAYEFRLNEDLDAIPPCTKGDWLR